MAEAADRPLIAPRLVAWAAEHGRHDLPWQLLATPYRVWVSESMLQQTQVATVVPYFERFIARFPTLDALADAEISEVLALWSGLGYYARARNLHAAARHCRDVYAGELPQTLAELTALPGIGRSTAGASLALGHGKRAPILDGNARRVLARYHATNFASELWRLAEHETPRSNVAAYTQAVMDLGAMLCTRRSPACEVCPLVVDCAAHAAGAEMDYPAPRPRRLRPLRERRFAWIERDGALLFEERPPAGIWGGLLCLPELPGMDESASWCSELPGLDPHSSRELPGFTHDFTHFRLTARITAFTVADETIGDTNRLRWLKPTAALAEGLPAPIRSYLAAHLARDTTTLVPT